MKKRIQKALCIACTLTIFSSCGKSPNEFEVPLDPSKWTDSTSFSGAISDLSPDDRKIVLSYLRRYSDADLYSGESTFGAILELHQEQVDQAEIDVIESEIESEIYDRNIGLLQRSTSVKLASTSPIFLNIPDHMNPSGEKQMSSLVIAIIEISNLSDVPIAGVKGKIQFKDSIGTLIAEEEIAETQSLSPKEAREVRILLRGQEIPSPLLDTSNFKMIWIPALVVFEDGREIRL
ncbi:MAG: hypothetical protein WD342_02180 [Verrucomicrobiales bacterium]